MKSWLSSGDKVITSLGNIESSVLGLALGTVVPKLQSVVSGGGILDTAGSPVTTVFGVISGLSAGTVATSVLSGPVGTLLPVLQGVVSQGVQTTSGGPVGSVTDLVTGLTSGMSCSSA